MIAFLREFNHNAAMWTLILALLLAVYPKTVSATAPYLGRTDRTWSLDEPFPQPLPRPNPRRDFQDIIGQFQQTCDFLNGMQERDRQSANFGGIHEGEDQQRYAIIESDNTQEAIRVWSEYALYFNDADRYRQDVADAWTYLGNFPAWQEGPPDWYALHNCGWGMMAEIGYRQVYGNAHADYGRQCAEWIVGHMPAIPVDTADVLIPLVAGWDAGTLYLYGDFTGNDDYRSAALRIASDVKAWIDHNPNRLHTNEVWALCGGTAMWGVLNSLGRSDSAGTADWATQKLAQMDVFAGRGEWNNSWNIWYANAWLAANSLIGDDQYLTNAKVIVDSLVAQDLDDDGGIPATGGEGSEHDQSWVSAYTAWMGLRPFFNRLPDVDLTFIGLVSPLPDSPDTIGFPVTMQFNFQQRGFLSEVEAGLHLRGAWNYDTTIVLHSHLPTQLTMLTPWIPQGEGAAQFTSYLSHDQEADPSDDTIHYALPVAALGDVAIQLVSPDQTPVGGTAVFTNRTWNAVITPDTIIIDSRTGQATASLLDNAYDIYFTPNFPFADLSLDSFVVVANEETPLIVQLTHPVVLLADNDTDNGQRSHYYESAMTEAGASFYNWNCNALGSVAGHSDGFATLLYFTGNRSEGTIPQQDRDEIEAMLARGGGVFISGQNIADELNGDAFLTNVLHANYLVDSLGAQQVVGVNGDPVLGGKRLLLLGNQGANNQNSPAGIAPVAGAYACGYYAAKEDTAAAVRWTLPSHGRGVFFAFGLEGISGQARTTSRGEVMRSVLRWMGTPLDVEEEKPEQPLPTQWRILSAWPNPFNSAVSIAISGHLPTGIQMNIFDPLGRNIRSLAATRNGVFIWDGKDEAGMRTSSGCYFASFVTGESILPGKAIRLVYMR